jgi:hypothetical protein
MTALLFDLLTLATALILIVRILPEWWLSVGDVAYQWSHR